MTAISFKSESSDDYLEISENEPLDIFLNRLKEEYGEEWYFLNVIMVKSTDFEEKEIREKIAYMQ